MDWRHRAACRDEDPELFFPVGNSGPALLQIAEAKTVCRRCPVLSGCLTWALESGQDAGVWGGMSEDERRALKRRQARTREKARAAERTTKQVVPVRVDGVLMAAPSAPSDRQFGGRVASERREHALMSNGKAACGSSRLDAGRRRPVSELAVSRRCRTLACQRVFAVADEEQKPVPVQDDQEPTVPVEAAGTAPVFATAGSEAAQWHALDEYGIPACGDPRETVVQKLARHVDPKRRCRRPRCANAWAQLDLELAVSHG
jgi:WhiB family redox-sensing transcriptional regulator